MAINDERQKYLDQLFWKLITGQAVSFCDSDVKRDARIAAWKEVSIKKGDLLRFYLGDQPTSVYRVRGEDNSKQPRDWYAEGWRKVS